MPKLFDNTELKKSLLEYLIQQQQKFKQSKLNLNIVQIGDNLSSKKYIGIKTKLGEKLNISVCHNHFDTYENIVEITKKLEVIINNTQKNNSGLIFQLPIPAVFQKFVDKIPVYSDVDLLSIQCETLWQQEFLPPTVGAIDLVLKNMLHLQNNTINKDISTVINYKLDLAGKVVAVIGQGILVGRPLIRYLLDRNATIVTVNKDTKNPQSLTKIADIVISGAGVPNLVNKTWLKSDAIVIDVATSNYDGQIFGDVDINDLHSDTFTCPSPKGVGPITVYYLFWNLLKLSLLDKKTDFELIF